MAVTREKPIKFALTGVAGFVAPKHLQAIRDLECELVAAADPHDCVGVLDMYFPHAMYFKEIERFDRFLEKARRQPSGQQIDYVSICSPNYLHDAHVRMALRVGAHAICEKPLVINPWNLDALSAFEEEYGCRVFTILQMRLLPSVLELKARLESETSTRDHEVDLTYVTRRGPWYQVSWKGSEEYSGGLAMNIGIHLFDLLIWLFGPAQRMKLYVKTPQKMVGMVELQRARVRWLLSIDERDLPKECRASGQHAYRRMLLDGEEIDLATPFNDLHTKVYEQTLAGRGFGIEDARPGIDFVHSLRHQPVVSAQDIGLHPRNHLSDRPGMSYFAHSTACIDEGACIGAGTKVWHFSHVMAGARIGRDCTLGQNVFVASGAQVGDHVKIQNNVSLYEGVVLENDVFCGPSAVFTNVVNPRSEIVRMGQCRGTFVRRGATVGANSTIVCGQTVGQYAFVAAGAVVTHDVLDFAMVAGVPARRIAWVCRCADERLTFNSKNVAHCSKCGTKYRLDGERVFVHDATPTCPAVQSSVAHAGDGKLPATPVSSQTPRSSELDVPMLDLKMQYAAIREEILGAVHEVLESQDFILSSVVAELEKRIAAYCGRGDAVGVSSGTDALLASLMAEGIGLGDEVITTPYTFFATIGSIMRLGAVPVFVDICPGTYNFDPSLIEAKITSRTRAILPVHLFGHCVEMDAVLEVAERHGLVVIEDAAQALGAEYRGHRAGSMGHYGCFSFFPSKNLGGAGDGGIVVTDTPARAEKLRLLRSHGAKPKHHHQILGGNFRLDALHAAILNVKLRYLDQWTTARRAHAKRYRELFEENEMVADGGVRLPRELPKCRHVYNQFVIRVDSRDRLRARIKEQGISTEVYYPVPAHLQPCLRQLGYHEGDLPESEQVARESLALPIFPELDDASLRRVADAVLGHLGSASPG